MNKGTSSEDTPSKKESLNSINKAKSKFSDSIPATSNDPDNTGTSSNGAEKANLNLTFCSDVTALTAHAHMRRLVEEDKSQEIKFLAGPIANTNVSTRASGEIHHSEESGIPSQGESFIIFPLPSTSEDVRNENHLRLTRIIDTSIWELPVESRQETPHNLTVETSSIENVNRIANDENCLHIPSVLSCVSDETETEVQSVKIDEGTNTEELNELNYAHVMAEWPIHNRDFELLTKLDDRPSNSRSLLAQSSHDPFYSSQQISDIFDSSEWFRPDLDDEDIPPGRRLRRESGTFLLNISK